MLLLEHSSMMTSVLPSLRPMARTMCGQCLRRTVTSLSHTAQEGDRVILRDARGDSTFARLTKPLKHGSVNSSHRGNIDHSVLIGKQSRDTVLTSARQELRIHLPTLEEYVTLTPRLVTPVYPADANLMVSLLDIHVQPPTVHSQDLPTLEILEAGTGHGALTLYLARAVHAANAHITRDSGQVNEGNIENHPIDPYVEDDVTRDLNESGNPRSRSHRDAKSFEGLSEEGKASRKAIVHTIDISAPHSKAAKKIVQGFRQGMYARNVEFHVGDVSDWISEQQEARASQFSGTTENAFLSHAILDMPASDQHMEKVSSVLHVDGVLMLFNPNLGQIMRAVNVVREKKLPLTLSSVLELGPSMTGGRAWDVRAVRPRALVKAEKARSESGGNMEDAVEVSSVEPTTKHALEEQSLVRTSERDKTEVPKQNGRGWETICRPMVGERIVGGGFLGVWKRMKPDTDRFKNV